jgi:hypothetical protein
MDLLLHVSSKKKVTELAIQHTVTWIFSRNIN